MKNKKRWILPSAVGGALLILAIICAVYLGSYYRADDAAVEAFAKQSGIDSEELDSRRTAYLPEGEIKAGLIFYPGGKVEHTAYIPLMQACAEKGILAILVEMPFRLAVLDKNAAEDVRREFPEVTSWYLGGHSLGGSMAAAYLEKTKESYDGLILLASYSTADLSQSGLRVLSVYGTQDGVMNAEKYAECLPNLPRDVTELVLSGGCHAGFGMYGAQKGDGEPTMTTVTQIRQTAEAISIFMTDPYRERRE